MEGRKVVVLLPRKLKSLALWGLRGILHTVGFTLYNFIKEATTHNPVRYDLHGDFPKLNK